MRQPISRRGPMATAGRGWSSSSKTSIRNRSVAPSRPLRGSAGPEPLPPVQFDTGCHASTQTSIVRARGIVESGAVVVTLLIAVAMPGRSMKHRLRDFVVQYEQDVDSIRSLHVHP